MGLIVLQFALNRALTAYLYWRARCIDTTDNALTLADKGVYKVGAGTLFNVAMGGSSFRAVDCR